VQLKSVSSDLTKASKRLRAEGIKIVEWGPDPVSNRVVVTLQNYSSAAARELISRYGDSWVRVRQTHQEVQFMAASGRFADGLPFYGGDGIWFGHAAPPSYKFRCSTGLSFIGNKSGKTFSLTAGHCIAASGGEAVYTKNSDPVQMGSVSKEYFPVDRLDIMSISGEFDGKVWNGAGTTYFINGTATNAVGLAVTADGAKSDEQNDLNVTAVDQTICLVPSQGSPCYDVDGIAKASKINTNVCQNGDSGGPVFVREGGSGTADAAGIISGYTVIGGQPQYDLCVYTQIGAILSEVNGHIQTFP
jgi:hypothetical protein